jgi:hypothetical protein
MRKDWLCVWGGGGRGRVVKKKPWQKDWPEPEAVLSLVGKATIFGHPFYLLYSVPQD